MRGVTRVTPEGYTIRRARAEDLAVLPEIERRASSLFDGLILAEGVAADVTTLADLAESQAADMLWVASLPEGQPVGFALVDLVDGAAHLDEIDVLPEHGRRGLGSALVRSVCEWARAQGLPAVTLTTFRDVPWNAPFYAALGFRDLAEGELTPDLAALVQSEHDGGLRRDLRVVMRFDIE